MKEVLIIGIAYSEFNHHDNVLWNIKHWKDMYLMILNLEICILKILLCYIEIYFVG